MNPTSEVVTYLATYIFYIKHINAQTTRLISCTVLPTVKYLHIYPTSEDVAYSATNFKLNTLMHKNLTPNIS